MRTVKLIVEHMVEKSNNTNCQSNSESKNIDQGKNLVFQQVPESNKKVVFEHSLVDFIHI